MGATASGGTIVADMTVCFGKKIGNGCVADGIRDSTRSAPRARIRDGAADRNEEGEAKGDRCVEIGDVADEKTRSFPNGS